MTAHSGDGQPNSFGQRSETTLNSIEKPLDSGSLTLWSKADFLHRAQWLARRLANWHLDDSGPIWAPKGIDFLRELERPFRYRVMLGEHDSKKTFTPPILLIPTAHGISSKNDVAGQAVTLHPDEYRKDDTIWLFRDYYEHLGQLGDSEAEELLQLKVQQLLDSRMYRHAYSERIGDYIAGHPVDHSLLDEFIEAAKHCFDNSSPGRRCSTCGGTSGSIESIELIEANTPKLDTESMEWIASRKENEEKLGYPTSTLAKYRLESQGGRQLSEYFGIDKDGRRWRRDQSKTSNSTVYYFATDVKKYGKKA